MDAGQPGQDVDQQQEPRGHGGGERGHLQQRAAPATLLDAERAEHRVGGGRGRDRDGQRDEHGAAEAQQDEGVLALAEEHVLGGVRPVPHGAQAVAQGADPVDAGEKQRGQ
ncbi:hypothetical protein GCM10010400_53960 [Streptomyces aculeolatus]